MAVYIENSIIMRHIIVRLKFTFQNMYNAVTYIRTCVRDKIKEMQ